MGCVCVVGDYPSVFLVFWVFWWMALATEGVVAGLPKHDFFLEHACVSGVQGD